MKIYIVVDRVDGEIDGVYQNRDDADAHAAAFDNSDNYYDMVVEEHVVKPHLYAAKGEEGR